MKLSKFVEYSSSISSETFH